ncbi:hypothetical protein PRIPAC_97740, partial [Pristionchus pacificus]|uniref:Ribosomal protein n=1 Tax=Pristionchus pacificus TaxID=54126 RepID=A0A2A6BY00_PRIPA
SAEAKKARLQARAEARAAGKKEEVTKRPNMVRFGIQNVTRAIETREAQLVLIAHDVDPLEVVIFLLALCRNFKIPYAIVKGKAALGTVVRRKVTVPEWSDLVKLGVTKDKGVENQDMEYLIMINDVFCLRSQMSVKTWKDDVVCWREEGLSYEEIRKKCLTIGIQVTLLNHMETKFGIPRLLRLESGVSSLRDTVIKRDKFLPIKEFVKNAYLANKQRKASEIVDEIAENFNEKMTTSFQ